MTFDKDILISYAHIDNESLIEGQKGWISEFHHSLEIRLAQLMGKKPKIWRDPKLQGNDFFAEEITDQIVNVATLVSILSPRYVASEWCQREVKEFYRGTKNNIGDRVKNKSRIFKVIKTPISLQEHPEIIRDVLGYEFFKIDSESGRPQEFGKLFGKDAELSFWEKLNDLAIDLSELLKEIEAMEEAQRVLSQQTQGNADGSTPGAGTSDKPTIFLAETSYDMREFREQLRRELEEYGYTVMPQNPLPLEANALRQELEGMLKGNVLSLHLIGNSYGVVPDGTEQSLVAMQNELAIECSKAEGLPRMVWVAPDSEGNDPRQQEFLSKMRTESLMQFGAEVIESPITAFKQNVHDKLEAIKKQNEAPEPEMPGDEAPPVVYLLCDQRDLDDIGEVEDFLFQQGFDVILPVFEGDEQQVRLDHQENMILADAVLIYYGQGNQLWIRSKSRDLLKIAGYGRKKPLAAKGVMLAGPESPDKKRFRAQGTHVMNCMAGFDAGQFNPFLTSIKNA